MDDGQGVQGETIVVELALNSGASSIAGFLLTVSVLDAGTARIVGVQFPDYSDPVTGFDLSAVLTQLPSGSATIAAVDLGGVLQAPFDRVVLATFSVELLGSGTTQLFVSELVRLDNSSGATLSPDLVAGILTVN